MSAYTIFVVNTVNEPCTIHFVVYHFNEDPNLLMMDWSRYSMAMGMGSMKQCVEVRQ